MATARTITLNVVGDTSNANAALAKIASTGEGAAGRLHAAFSGATSNIAGMFGPVGVALDTVRSSIEKVGGSGGAGVKGALLGIAGGVTALGVGMAVEGVRAADAYEKAHVALEQAIKNAGGTYEVNKKQIESLDSSFHQFGYTSEQTEGALSHFVTGTQDVQKSLHLMGLAADIAKARNIDLTSATDLVTKASEGNLRALKQMGIDLPVTAGNALKLQQAQDAVAKAQEAVNAATAKAGETAAQHAAHLKAQESATIAVQAAEEKLRLDRARGVPAFQLKIDTERLTIAQQSLASAQSQATAPAGALTAAQQRLAAAQQKLKDEQASGTEVLDALTQRFGGQASAAADTFGGKMAANSAKIHDLKVKLGQELEPALTSVLDYATNEFVPRFSSGLSRVSTSFDNLVHHFWDTKMGDWLQKMGMEDFVHKFEDGLHRLEAAWDPFWSRFASGIGRIKSDLHLGGIASGLDFLGHAVAAPFQAAASLPFTQGPSQPAAPITVNVQTNADPHAISSAIVYGQSARGL